MTCMHPYLMWNVGYPLGWSIVIGCLCLLTKAFFALPMYWLIRMLAFHSNVSAVPISGCLRRLLLLLFIKLDSAPKCGVACSTYERFSPGFFWELSSDWLCAPRQHPSWLSISHELASSWNKYSSSICYHQSSWKLSSHLGMHLIACSTKAHGCILNVLLNRFLSALLIRLWKEMSRPHQWCCFYHPYSYGEVHIWLQYKLSHGQSSWLVPFQHSFNAVMW